MKLKNKNIIRSGGRLVLTAAVFLFLVSFVSFGAGKSSPVEAGRVYGGQQMRTVVIDPGHGGIETGAKGKSGTMEKDVTLAVALKLKARIESSMSYEVVLTRDRDIDVPIEMRAAIANNNKADVFVSIHANGSKRETASGSETFFMSLNATDEETRRLAYLENRGSEIKDSMATSSEDELEMILWDMAQTAFIKQSSRLAEMIQAELNGLLGTRNRGIKQAPFKVLCGVAAPAVLVEVAFISNPEEEKKLTSDRFQEGIASAIYNGLSRFLRLYE